MLSGFYNDESGQTMVEYGLILGFVSIVAFALLLNIRVPLQGFFKSVTEITENIGK